MSLKFSTLSWRSLYCSNNKARIFGICNPLSTPFPLKVSYSSLLSTRRALPCRANLYTRDSSTISVSGEVPLLGVELEDELVGYIFGRKKATDVAHSVWKHVVRKGDIVVDATCGNGYDTLAMVKLVAGASGRGGCVYGMDIQKDALSNTYLMLGASLCSDEEELVKLFPMCHSKMEEVIPKDATVRLVAFNLGYLPGGDKTITTTSETTFLALEAARRIVEPGGLISVVVYVGHPSGREEFETVQKFASGLPTDDWVCCKLQMLNRPLAPVPIFMFRR